eukprot:364344-Chlamydomonas_euryale.AAC.10
MHGVMLAALFTLAAGSLIHTRCLPAHGRPQQIARRVCMAHNIDLADLRIRVGRILSAVDARGKACTGLCVGGLISERCVYVSMDGAAPTCPHPADGAHLAADIAPPLLFPDGAPLPADGASLPPSVSRLPTVCPCLPTAPAHRSRPIEVDVAWDKFLTSTLSKQLVHVLGASSRASVETTAVAKTNVTRSALRIGEARRRGTGMKEPELGQALQRQMWRARDETCLSWKGCTDEMSVGETTRLCRV